jgi:Mrp family chromosome partitioning ATPase
MIARSAEPGTRAARPRDLFPDEVLEPYRLLLSQPGLAPSAPPAGGLSSAPQAGTPCGRTLGLTSSASGEGVSTVAAQLAVAAARFGMGRVLLVDANLARPAAHRAFGLDPGPGLAELLLEGQARADVLQPAGIEHLAVLTAGRLGGRLAQAQEALVQGAILEALKAEFDLVMFDLPASRAGPFTARLAARLDAVLLVVEAEKAPHETVQREKELLARAGAPLLGAVLNKRRQYLPDWLQRRL